MRQKITSESSGNVLNMENMRRQKDRGKGCGNRGNNRKVGSKSKLGNIECWNCGKKVHLKKECRAPKKQRDGQQEKNQEANVIGDVLQYESQKILVVSFSGNRNYTLENYMLKVYVHLLTYDALI
jgi:hypothetical protein